MISKELRRDKNVYVSYLIPTIILNTKTAVMRVFVFLWFLYLNSLKASFFEKGDWINSFSILIFITKI